MSGEAKSARRSRPRGPERPSVESSWTEVLANTSRVTRLAALRPSASPFPAANLQACVHA
eukprot:2683602-Alexandrium_andersonii.AAC.1